jgi:hypothetical protein
MDEQAMSLAGVSGGTLTALVIAYKLFQWVNHRHFRSSCCGRVAEGSIDVDSPPRVVVLSSIPPQTNPTSS